MGLNAVIQRLTEAPKAKVWLHPDYPEHDWLIFRRIWDVRRYLRCSRCAEALERRCHRGPERARAHKSGYPCFRGNPGLIEATAAIVAEVRAADSKKI